MNKRRRYRFLVVLLLSVVPAVLLVIGLAIGDGERMLSYFEVATVASDGSARVEEVIDYDFGAGSSKHGLIRIVPDLASEESVTVSSPTAPDQVQITGGRLRIGDPDQTVSGTHRYEIGYDLDTLVDGDELAWNIVGDEWDVEIESVEAHLFSERSFRTLSCDEGTFGTIGGCEATEVGPGHAVVRTGPVPSGSAVTIRATLGAPVEMPTQQRPEIPATPDDTGAPLLLPALLGFVLAAGAGTIVLRLLRRAGREEAPDGRRVDVTELMADSSPRVTPPDRLTPAQGGVVLTETVEPQHKAAWLLSHAQHGAVALEGDAESPTLRWLGEHGAQDNMPLLTMFQGRTTLQLGTYDEDFAKGWKMVEAELEGWRSSSGLWSPAGERRRLWSIGVGGGLMVLGVILVAVMAYLWSLREPTVMQLALLCLPFGIGAGLALGAWELRVRTPEGSTRFVEVEAFRRFLHRAAAADVDRAAEAGSLHDYVAWAVALDESKVWTEAVEAATVEPRGISYDPTLLYLASNLHASTSATSTAPSSSTGGGGGGAGGGGGGGGGGSW